MRSSRCRITAACTVSTRRVVRRVQWQVHRPCRSSWSRPRARGLSGPDNDGADVMRPAINVSAPQRPSWLIGLVLALVGFAVWTAFSLWPVTTQPGQPFRIREAWDTAMFWRVGVPLMLLAQAIGGAVLGGSLRW